MAAPLSLLSSTRPWPPASHFKSHLGCGRAASDARAGDGRFPPYIVVVAAAALSLSALRKLDSFLSWVGGSARRHFALRRAA